MTAGAAAEGLVAQIAACRLCADRFAVTHSAHAPRPVPWFDPRAKVLISGQAPGLRVHQSGRPFDDASGQRLRDWLGMTPDVFYDRARVAVVPMAFCFPGYDAKGHDLVPPAICAATWRGKVLESLQNIRLRVLVGGAAIGWHLGKAPVAQHLANWRDHAAKGIFVLPHPSWRNTGWLNRNPWFAVDLLPELRQAVLMALADQSRG